MKRRGALNPLTQAGNEPANARDAKSKLQALRLRRKGIIVQLRTRLRLRQTEQSLVGQSRLLSALDDEISHLERFMAWSGLTHGNQAERDGIRGKHRSDKPVK